MLFSFDVNLFNLYPSNASVYPSCWDNNTLALTDWYTDSNLWLKRVLNIYYDDRFESTQGLRAISLLKDWVWEMQWLQPAEDKRGSGEHRNAALKVKEENVRKGVTMKMDHDEISREIRQRASELSVSEDKVEAEMRRWVTWKMSRKIED